MKLLIIDDDPNYVKAVSSSLVSMNHEVQSYLAPKEAWKFLQKSPDEFDAVLLDLIMPGMSGLALLRKIREAGISLPIVLVSGYADLESSAEAVHWGISGLLIKPFVPGQMMRTLAKVEKDLGMPQVAPLEKHVGHPDENIEDLQEGLQGQITQVMNESINCWNAYCGGNRANLAERSGLWKANLDGTSLRTRTMDRYMQPQTLPKRPNIKKVLATAYFVLDNCTPSSRRFKLETKTRMLEFTLDALGLWSPQKKRDTFRF